MASDLVIRPAAPHELRTVLAVDDDACRLYALSGIDVLLPEDHPFAVAERTRWAASLAAGDVRLAVRPDGRVVGFAALGTLDGAPYLDQLSVRLDDGRRGVGSALLEAAVDWAAPRGGDLWLNTYGHLPFNRPFYERRGFRVVPEVGWGPQMRSVVAAQRACLPRPEERVVMRRTVASTGG